MTRSLHDLRALSLDDPIPHIRTLFRKRTWMGEDLTHSLFTITTDSLSSGTIITHPYPIKLSTTEPAYII